MSSRRIYGLAGVLLKTSAFASSILLVFLPSLFIVSFIFTNWDEIVYEVFANPLIGDTGWKLIQSVLGFSFKLSLITVLLDVALGVPIAYLLAYKRFPGRGFLEDLVSLPLVVPTSGFGFATLTAWTTSVGLGGLLGLKRGLIDITATVPGLDLPILMLLVHVSLTLPYLVKPLQARLTDVGSYLIEASRTLGASPTTTFRKVILPLCFPALISGSVMGLARSLGETGATMIVSGVYMTAAVAIVRWEFEFKIATAAFLGGLLILLAWLLVLPLELTVSRRGWLSLPNLTGILGFEPTLVRIEAKLSSKTLASARNLLSVAVLLLLVILPPSVLAYSTVLYWTGDPYTGKVEGGVLYQVFLGPTGYGSMLSRALLTSFAAAGLSTFLSTCIAIPLVYIIEEYRAGRILRALLKIPLIIPTSALGLSSLLLWGPKGFNVAAPGFWLIVLTHIVFSVPVLVESIIAVFEGSGITECEGVARTLGASPLDVAELVSLPMLKRGILAGVILSFSHSLGETGATFIVMGSDYTVSTLVVNMVESLAIPAALFSSLILIAVSFVFLVSVRVILGG